MKLKDKKGLTLVEMLCTVAILVLVSMVMVLGVQLGVRSYAKSVSYSEAQVLCSTLTTTISDELRYSGTLKVNGSGSVTGFFSQQFGSGDYTAFTVYGALVEKDKEPTDDDWQKLDNNSEIVFPS